MLTVQNPIQSLSNWHSSRVGNAKEEATPSYEAALDSFNKDVEALKSMDRDQFSPKPTGFGFGPTDFNGNPIPQDSDMRPGEVEVHGVGSLHSTPEGFSLKLIEKGYSHYGSLFMGKKSDDTRSYQVNEKNGTIAVVNTFGSSMSYGMQSASSKEGYTETYILDTKNGEIRDFESTEHTAAASGAKSMGVLGRLAIAKHSALFGKVD